MEWSAASRMFGATPRASVGCRPSSRRAGLIFEATKAGKDVRVACGVEGNTRDAIDSRVVPESRFHAPASDSSRFHAETSRFEEDGMIFPRVAPSPTEATPSANISHATSASASTGRAKMTSTTATSATSVRVPSDARAAATNAHRPAAPGNNARPRTRCSLKTDARGESVAEKTNDTLEDRRGYPRIASRRGVTLAVVARIAGTNRACFATTRERSRRGGAPPRVRFSPLTPRERIHRARSTTACALTPLMPNALHPANASSERITRVIADRGCLGATRPPPPADAVTTCALIRRR